ncbi:NAD(P)-dependent oxidoreductase [Salinadaptatus halalkaliphilus]|uniref:NAD(P)-dependent oxidoreductase n=1 Tax=Salinadaptatus halalkaliphilus TaxID=2419781 RepID=A0A4S3TKP7_9EURY|nr:NAD(P)-dependent oxidoreductase [Salinadaptatus halalkaliphilus]THE64606.1 NAD(P)-dependent oxidoreductase [Salinadaptatus halalkaliphilus]
MKLLVTGATGGIGSWTVDRLASAGHDVVGVDLERPPEDRPNARFYAADLTDYGQAIDLFQTEEPDAVVHCASIPKVGIRTGPETFRINVECTYNVFVAAGSVGTDIVWTSSESIYGTPFAEEVWLPDYLPIDESHTYRPEDPYGTSKLVGEELAEMIVRRDGVSVVSLRPSWVNYPGEYALTDVRESFDPETADRSGNFWSYVDVRDVTSLIEAALEADIDGHESYLAVAENNYLGRPTAETIETVFGERPDRCTLEGESSAYSTAKARRELGWEPEHTWRSAEDESAEGPAFVK